MELSIFQDWLHKPSPLCVGCFLIYHIISLLLSATHFFISKNWSDLSKKKKKRNFMEEYWRVLSILLKSGGNPALKMGRNQGKFHSQSCTLEVAEVGTWGVCHFWCCLVILGYAAYTTSTMTLDPAAWETSYCWKVLFLTMLFFTINF